MQIPRIVSALAIAALATPLAAAATDLRAAVEPQASFVGAAELPAEALQLPPDERTWMEKVPRDFLLGAAQASGELDCIVVFRQSQGLRDFSVASFDHPGRLRWIADTAAALESDLAPLGVKMPRRYSHLPMARVTLPAPMLSLLAGDPRVEAVTPNRVAHAFRAEGKALMNVPVVHGLGFNGSGVTVAVLDSGVDYTHAELAPGGAASTNKTVFGADAIDSDGDPMDGEGHGTSTSGIIAGSTGGVAPQAKVYAVRVLNNFGEGSGEQILAGINDVIARTAGGNPLNIKVANLSLGGYFDSGVPPQPCDTDVPDFAAAFATMISAGVLPVISAGNGGCTTGVAWPACISSTLAVGAVYDAAFGGASFADGLCMPSGCSDLITGPDVVTCYSDSGAARLDVWGPSHCATTPALGGGYDDCFGGTSAAAPYVAGVAALLTHAVPGRTATGLKDAIRSNGADITDPRNGVTKKSVRADLALAALQGGGCTAPAVPTGVSSSRSSFCQSESFTLSWIAVSAAASYSVQIAESPAFSSPQELTSTQPSLSLTFTGATPASFYLRVRANASCGASSSYSSIVQVSYTGTNCGGPTYTAAYYVSAIATRLPGFPPAVWFSDLAVLNAGTSPADIRLSYFGTSTPAPVTATVAAGQQRSWEDVLGQAFGIAAADKGDLVVESTQPVVVVARTYSKYTDTCDGNKVKTYGQDYPGLDVTRALSAGQTGFLPNLRSDGSYRTNVEAVNPGTIAAQVEFTFFNNSGTQVGAPVVLNVAAGRRADQSRALAAGQAAAFARVRVLTANAKAIAFASVIDGNSTDPTTVDLVIP